MDWHAISMIQKPGSGLSVWPSYGSRAALPYLTLPYLTLPYLTLPYLTLLYLTLPYLTLSVCHAMPCHYREHLRCKTGPKTTKIVYLRSAFPHNKVAPVKQPFLCRLDDVI